MRIAIRPKLTHVGINVWDLQRMTAFYKEVLGLLETDRGRGITIPTELVFLSSDPACHHQLVLSSGRRAQDESMVNQLSFLLPGLDDLRANYRNVRAHGVGNLRAVNHGNAWSIYFADPENNTVEIYVDTPWYVSQPHADPLDLSLANETILSATEVSCRKDPNFMLVAQWQARVRAALDAADMSVENAQ
jgi:catechol 2,3-dioxygenase